MIPQRNDVCFSIVPLESPSKPYFHLWAGVFSVLLGDFLFVFLCPASVFSFKHLTVCFLSTFKVNSLFQCSSTAKFLCCSDSRGSLENMLFAQCLSHVYWISGCYCNWPTAVVLIGHVSLIWLYIHALASLPKWKCAAVPVTQPVWIPGFWPVITTQIL